MIFQRKIVAMIIGASFAFSHLSCSNDTPEARCESFCHIQKQDCKGNSYGPAADPDACEVSCPGLLCVYAAYGCAAAADAYHVDCAEQCVDDLINNTETCLSDDRLRDCLANGLFDASKQAEANKCTAASK
jgi:hypothetical protein